MRELQLQLKIKLIVKLKLKINLQLQLQVQPQLQFELQLQVQSQMDWITSTGLTALARNGTRDSQVADVGTSCVSSHADVVESMLHWIQPEWDFLKK